MTDDRSFIAVPAMPRTAVWIRRAAKNARQSDGFATAQPIRADDDAAADWLSA
jgi:hypothetical protein